MSFRPARRNPPDRKPFVVSLGDPSTKSLRDFAFGTAQDDIFSIWRDRKGRAYSVFYLSKRAVIKTAPTFLRMQNS